MSSDTWQVGRRTFSSRLLVGTGKYRDFDETRDAIEASGAEIITVAQQMADRLTLALRSVADTQQKNLAEADYLVSGSGKRGTVRLIKSGEISESGARK